MRGHDRLPGAWRRGDGWPNPQPGGRRRLEELAELFEEGALGLGADDSFGYLAVTEDQKRGDAHDLEPTSDVEPAIGVS